MKANQLDILIIPGYKGSGPDHWQTRWEQKLSTACRVEQACWSKPVCKEWVNKVETAIAQAQKPVALIAHSLGVPTAILATAQNAKKVRGAFLVAPPDVDNEKIHPKHLMTFGPYHREKLPFPSVVIASHNDEFCQFSVAEKLASDWGAFFVDAGQSGHINAESGHGPWPEGLMVLSHFLAKL
ncbi:RBBP9/YdeN family alpha/beta hydrolase [Bartonella sp. A05]|uniref:RBBP9/YdeN family alpha/beta hydrolase n=1 Tax=Bartonella sp. A05 TaxID=2967261 RepID=UPI0022A99BAA|nr:alpha/beta hydrolase [Bartonella sp. A05]MCZ2204397.1 alpha/beta hydrolase [Bartonella sp. A05]